MRKLALLIAIILTAGFGTFLLCGYGEDDRGIGWPRAHLNVIQDQLTDLKTHLQLYKQVHDRYPTNDEGTAVLDNWVAKYFVKCSHDPNSPPWQINEFDGLSARYWWLNARQEISDYRKTTGHVPKNREEFAETRLGFFLGQTDTSSPASFQVEVVIGKGDNLFILSQAGALTPWRTPYIYENRNGLDPAKFKDSPANNDKQGEYSVRVHDGIFLYALEACPLAEGINLAQWERTRIKLLGGVFLFIAVILMVLMVRSGWASAKVSIAAILLSSGAGLAADRLLHTTCYVMGSCFSRPDAEMIAQQRELLDRYHQRGVIGDAAYAKSVAALENGPATQRCNHDCPHCYNAWKNAAPYPSGELATARTLEMLGRMIDQTGARLVTLSGGEPLLRADIFEIVDYLAGRKLSVNFLTNGALLNGPAVEKLSPRKVSIFELPLLSADDAVHDRLSGRRGAFAGVTMAIANLKAARQRVVCVFVATTLNLPTWRDTAELAIALGADGIMFNRFNPGGAGGRNIELLQATPQALAEAMDEAPRLVEQYRVPISCSIPMPPCLFDHSRWPKLGFGFCAAGTERAYYTLDPLGNIFERSFSKTAASAAMKTFMAARPQFCGGCRLETTCLGGCKAAAEACCGSLDAPDPFLAAYQSQAVKP